MSERHIQRLFLPWQQVYFMVKKHQTFIIIMSTKISPPLIDTNYFLDVFVDVVSRKNICRLHPASMPPLPCLPSASASDRKRPSTRRPLQACRAPITRQKTSLYIKLQTAKNLKNKKKVIAYRKFFNLRYLPSSIACCCQPCQASTPRTTALHPTGLPLHLLYEKAPSPLVITMLYVHD